MNFYFLLGQSTGIVRQSFPIVPRSLLMLASFAALGRLTKVQADGMFVAPKFVWDKHKDINEPTQKAIMVYDAGREDLILQVKYEGPVEEFGWLIPVPDLPTVQKGSMKCFYELSKYTQKHFEWRHGLSHTKSANGGARTLSAGVESEPPVKVIEVKTVGAYEVAVLSTKDAGALENWLATNQFYFPTNKTDVLNDYVKQQWYFIAVKVNLGQGFLGTISNKLELALGELHPLQISFASDHCVYPLKISSVNGTPSEIQVYVLSPEPLLEKAMLERKLPLIYEKDMKEATERVRTMKRSRFMERDVWRIFLGEPGRTDSPLWTNGLKTVQKIIEAPVATYDDFWPYAKVTRADLPDCGIILTRFGNKSWWLTKQTWKIKPAEMRDLEFAPVWSVYSDELGTKYGYYAAAGLAAFGLDAVPAIIAAMQSTNSIVRVNTAGIFFPHLFGGYTFEYERPGDSRLAVAALTWLKDSEPAVRYAGVKVLTDYAGWHRRNDEWNPQSAELLVAGLRDPDALVRHAVIVDLIRLSEFGYDLGNQIPKIQQMLKDKDPTIQDAALETLVRMNADIPRDYLRQFFKSDYPQDVSWAFARLSGQGEKFSDDDALILLQNPQPVVRLLGLRVLDQNPEKQSVELALPLLHDPNELVRQKTAQTLRMLTGQHFTEDQANEWRKWWQENKTNFVPQQHPDEF